MQKELINIQTPDNKLVLVDLNKMIASIRQRNNTLEVQNKTLENNDIWYENRNKELQSKIDSYRRKTNDVEGENKLLEQKKNSRYDQSSQTKKINEPRTYTAKIEEVNQRV